MNRGQRLSIGAVAGLPQWSQRHTGARIVATLSALETLSIIARAGPPVQPVLSVLFVVFCPGAILLDLDEPKRLDERLLLCVAASVALNLIIATIAVIGWAAIGAIAAVTLPLIIILWPRGSQQ